MVSYKNKWIAQKKKKKKIYKLKQYSLSSFCSNHLEQKMKNKYNIGLMLVVKNGNFDKKMN